MTDEDTRGYPKGAARRQAIVEVATDLFGRLGYRGATMLQIAAACGISRAGLLHHFPSKESLLTAVLERRDAVDGARLAAARRDPDDLLAPWRELVAVTEHNASVPQIVRLFAVLSAEAGDVGHPAHAWFTRRYDDLRATLEQAGKASSAAGLLAEATDPAVFAVELVALMDGLQVQWLLAPDRVDMATVLRGRIAAALVPGTVFP